MEKLLLSVAAAAALTFASFGARAGHDANEGAFIGVNAGSSSYDIHNSGFEDKKDTAFGGVVGYRWAVDRPFYFGVEGGYVNLGKLTDRYEGSQNLGTANQPYIDAYKEKYELKGHALLIGANGKWVLPHRFTITARFGLAHSHSAYDASYNETLNGVNVDSESIHQSSNDNGIYAGVGFGYDFTPNFGVTVNYDNYSLKAQKLTGDKRTVNVGVWGGAAEFRF
jgi:hypothetical protein